MKLIDLHCDTASKLYYSKEKDKLYKNNFHVDIEKLRKSESYIQCFAMFIQKNKVERPFVECISMIRLFYQELIDNEHNIQIFLSANDLNRYIRRNRIMALLTIEEGAALENKIENITLFHHLGIRMITLLWNHPNEIGFPHTYQQDGNHGLTPFGLQVIKEMERVGMIIDVSHLSDDGFYDVLNNTTKPFIASHSNARSICNHSRNLTDDMILQIAKRKGVIGINFYHRFLNEHKEKSEIEDIIKHIKHIVSIGGIDTVSIGSDFDGIDSQLDIKDISYMHLLEEALIKEGFSQDDIEKIFYKNALRVICEVCK